MDDAEGTAEELEDGKVLQARAEELFRIATAIRDQAQRLLDQTKRSAGILAAKKADRVE
jgi:hypothetical protein